MAAAGCASFRGAAPNLGDRAAALNGVPYEGFNVKTVPKPRNFMVVVGTAVMVLVVLMPVLGAIQLMDDATFVFFVGRLWPTRIIWVCAGAVLAYATLVVFFFACAREKAKTDHSMYMIVSIVLTTLGVSLLLLSVPLKNETMQIYDEIFTNCQFGLHTQRLYEYSTVLQGLRAMPDCQTRVSVESCPGYQDASPYTGFLKSLESNYMCAGFCFGNSTLAAAAAAVAAEPEAVIALSDETEGPAVAGPQGGGTPDAVASGLLSASASISPRPAKAIRHVDSPSQILLGGIAASANDEGGASSIEALSRANQKGAGGKLLAGALQRFAAERMQQQAAPAAGPSENASWSLLQAATAAGAPLYAPARRSGNFVGSWRSLQPAPPGPAAAGSMPPPVAAPATTASTSEPGRQGSFPPTLFSLANYQATCDGMVTRSLKFQALDVASLCYQEGVGLLLSVVIAGFLRICGFCVQVHPRLPKRLDVPAYGAI